MSSVVHKQRFECVLLTGKLAKMAEQSGDVDTAVRFYDHALKMLPSIQPALLTEQMGLLWSGLIHLMLL